MHSNAKLCVKRHRGDIEIRHSTSTFDIRLRHSTFDIESIAVDRSRVVEKHLKGQLMLMCDNRKNFSLKINI